LTSIRDIQSRSTDVHRIGWTALLSSIVQVFARSDPRRPNVQLLANGCCKRGRMEGQSHALQNAGFKASAQRAARDLPDALFPGAV
jgi:hypothetical protein